MESHKHKAAQAQSHAHPHAHSHAHSSREEQGEPKAKEPVKAEAAPKNVPPVGKMAQFFRPLGEGFEGPLASIVVGGNPDKENTVNLTVFNPDGATYGVLDVPTSEQEKVAYCLIG
jgi:hypothetical protein